MPVTRRNTLAVLGLAGAGAVGIEGVAAKSPISSPVPATRLDRSRLVAAVRAFADAIERGEFAPRSVECIATLEPGNVALNRFTVQFFNKGLKDADA